ncbi:hypothetical protein ASG31_07675 [Chryseobacterium sp. Leaf404]|uniref:hypothetical protein n=1 Tax=unclassified Chryseobacterium TaxID=2593645 RepID=UPI0006F7B066|nr:MULTISPECIES: hypothetical protein [unclassified Chryseobacterium]KQT18585.1 hypothetical protein ASG31_07675 [Chryseobacterium sp. Leaf404]
MKKYLISALLIVGLSTTALAQRHPPRPAAPVHPSKTQFTNSKASELNKRYRNEKRLIMSHPVATKKMKAEQIKALNLRYQNEKKLLKAAR